MLAGPWPRVARLSSSVPHPTDRRAKQLTLTPEGAELRATLLKALTEGPLLTSLTKQEQDTLQDLLRRAISRR